MECVALQRAGYKSGSESFSCCNVKLTFCRSVALRLSVRCSDFHLRCRAITVGNRSRGCRVVECGSHATQRGPDPRTPFSGLCEFGCINACLCFHALVGNLEEMHFVWVHLDGSGAFFRNRNKNSNRHFVEIGGGRYHHISLARRDSGDVVTVNVFGQETRLSRLPYKRGNVPRLRDGMNPNAEQQNRQSVVSFHWILQNANVLDGNCSTAPKIG